MQKRLCGLLATVVIVVAACGSSTSTAAPSQAAVATPAAATAAPTAAAPATPAPTAVADPAGHHDHHLQARGGRQHGRQARRRHVGRAEHHLVGHLRQLRGRRRGLRPVALEPVEQHRRLQVLRPARHQRPHRRNGGVTLVGDGMDVKVELIPGALWSDGKPITCQDIADQWKWQMDPANTGTVTGTQGYEDISSIDGGTGTSCVDPLQEGLRAVPQPVRSAAADALREHRLRSRTRSASCTRRRIRSPASTAARTCPPTGRPAPRSTTSRTRSSGTRSRRPRRRSTR